MRDLINQHSTTPVQPEDDIARECTAVIKVACPHCRAPAGSHCASVINTIVWPPHLCRMDAYTHRLCPSEDWPMRTAGFSERLQHVKSTPATRPFPTRMLWKTLIEKRLVKNNEYGRPLLEPTTGDDTNL